MITCTKLNLWEVNAIWCHLKLDIGRKNKRLAYLILSVACALLILGPGMPHAHADLSTSLAPKCQTDGIEYSRAKIISIADNGNGLMVFCNKQRSCKVDETASSRAGSFSPGDIISFRLDPQKQEIVSMDHISIQIAMKNRLLAIGIAALSLFLASLVVLWCAKGQVFAFRELFVGSDRRLSNSKSQAAIWFFTLLACYIGITIIRVSQGGFGFLGGISIPQNLLFLSGFSTFSYVGAKAITQSQVNRVPESKPSAPAGSANLSDYVTNDSGETDFGDFQMSTITLLAVAMFIMQIINFSGSIELAKNIQMPDLDTTVLSLFGLSQGGYLVKKTAQAAGAQAPQTLKLGSKDPRIIQITKQLNKILNRKAGQMLDETSDNFDAKVEAAVKEFQKMKGLQETGLVDGQTNDAIFK